MSCYVKIVNNSRKSEIKYVLEHGFEFFDTLESLELLHVFIQANEQVYARISHVIWKHKDLYSKIIFIMGGFHQLRVFQRVLFKRFHYLGLQD